MLIRLEEGSADKCCVCGAQENIGNLKLGQIEAPICRSCQVNLKHVLAAAEIFSEEESAGISVVSAVRDSGVNVCYNPPKFWDKACRECKFFDWCGYEKKGA